MINGRDNSRLLFQMATTNTDCNAIFTKKYLQHVIFMCFPTSQRMTWLTKLQNMLEIFCVILLSFLLVSKKLGTYTKCPDSLNYSLSSLVDLLYNMANHVIQPLFSYNMNMSCYKDLCCKFKCEVLLKGYIQWEMWSLKTQTILYFNQPCHKVKNINVFSLLTDSILLVNLDFSNKKYQFL